MKNYYDKAYILPLCPDHIDFKVTTMNDYYMQRLQAIPREEIAMFGRLAASSAIPRISIYGPSGPKDVTEAVMYFMMPHMEEIFPVMLMYDAQVKCERFLGGAISGDLDEAKVLDLMCNPVNITIQDSAIDTRLS